MEISNAKVAKIFRDIAAAYSIKGNKSIFGIRAYENAADSVERSTVEVQDLWQEGKLDQVPGLGEKLQGYLDELFKTGKVRHFELAKQGIEPIVFELLDVPGVGPKTAQEIAKLGVKSIDDLKKQIKRGRLAEKGFSAKIAQKIMEGLRELASRGNRMLLPYAAVQADKITKYLRENKYVEQVHPLGSLRRMVATVGDLDFSVASKSPKEVIEYFCKMPGVVNVLDKGGTRATVVLQSGVQADLLVVQPASYGALLQHFTGSKSHNIHLRIIAEKKGLSLSEYGVKKGNKVIPTETEEEFYKYLEMDTPAPEIREDSGEIEAALKHQLPNLVKLEDIKGDLHLHSNYPIISPSHGPGVDSIEEIVKTAQRLGYEYVGISDHPPGFSRVSRGEIVEWVERRTKFIQNLRKRTKSVRVLNGLEVDILGDGTLSVPDDALKTLDYVIAGIHSGHRGHKDVITSRLTKALENPYVDIISHPTNRLLNERESSEADWKKIFEYCAKNNKILEINAFPNRLDLREDLVRQAQEVEVKFIINTDAHEVSQMNMMPFGVAVARRGWATKKDIVNSWDWKDFAKWFKIHL